jgi:uncharacterized protein (TIGR04141 family)
MFDKTVNTFNDVIKREKLSGDDPYFEVHPKKELPYEAKFYFQKRIKEPKWTTFIEDYFDIEEMELENNTCSFIVLLKTNGRFFAITKGFSSHLFDRSKLESHFGLKVCLNEIDPESIKCLDSKSLETNTKHKRVVVSSNSFLGDFDFNADAELLNLVSGIPLDSEIAKSMTGSDPITFTNDDIDLESLEIYCQKLLQSFNKKTYEEHFKFIDYIKPVSEEEKINQLNQQLLDDLSNRVWEKFLITYPDIPDLELIEKWKISYKKSSREYDELNLDSIKDFLDFLNFDNQIDPLEINIYCLDSNNEFLRGKQTLDDFLSYEINYQNEKFIYSRHKWYNVNNSFLNKVNKSIEGIEIKSSDYLPSWDSSINEGDYNLLAVNNNRACLDKKFCQIDGRGKIEICDILEFPSTFIHVKKFYSSQTMGHLFNQGVISALVLREDKAMILSWMKDKILDFDMKNIESDKDIEIVFAIGINTNDKPLIQFLPFFSKVALFNAKKTIENTCGYKISLCKILYIQHDTHE